MMNGEGDADSPGGRPRRLPGRHEFPGFKRRSDLVERKPQIKLLFHPSRLVGRVQRPASRSTPPSHAPDLRGRQEALLLPAPHGGLVDPGGRCDLLCGGPGEGGRHGRSVGQEAVTTGCAWILDHLDYHAIRRRWESDGSRLMLERGHVYRILIG